MKACVALLLLLRLCEAVPEVHRLSRGTEHQLTLNINNTGTEHQLTLNINNTGTEHQLTLNINNTEYKNESVMAVAELTEERDDIINVLEGLQTSFNDLIEEQLIQQKSKNESKEVEGTGGTSDSELKKERDNLVKDLEYKNESVMAVAELTEETEERDLINVLEGLQTSYNDLIEQQQKSKNESKEVEGAGGTSDSELKKERDNLVKDLQQLQTSYNNLIEHGQKYKNESKMEVAELTIERDDLVKELEELETSYNDLIEREQKYKIESKKEVAELKKDGDKLVKDLELLRSIYNKLNEQKVNLQSRFDQLMSSHQNLTEENDLMDSSYQELQISHYNLSEQYDYLQSRYNNQTEQKEQIQSSLDQLKINHTTLKEEGGWLRSRYNRLIAMYRAEVTRIRCERWGFTWDGKVCYYFSTLADGFTSWNESRQFCKWYHSDLIIINSQAKQDLMDRVVPRNSWLWIGLTDGDDEEAFKWVDGTPLTSPTFWRLGHPKDPKRDGNCVYYYNGVPDRGGLWGAFRCSNPLRWLCEKVVQ